MTATNANAIADAIRGAYLTVRLPGSKTLRANTKYEEGRDAIVAARGGDAESFTSSIKLYPKGYDTEFKALRSAYSAVRAHFYKRTLPFGSAGDKAEGERLLPSDPTIVAEFEAEHNQLIDELDQAREHFAVEILYIVQRLATHAHDTGWRDFDRGNYPSADEVRDSFRYEPLQWGVIENAGGVRALPLPSDKIEQIETQMTQRVESQYKFGIQREMANLMGYLQTMAEQTQALAEWESTPEDQRPAGRKRAPRIGQSLVTNVRETVDKIKTYAVPETMEGAKLHKLAGKIEQVLALDTLTPEQIKHSALTAAETGAKAERIAKALDDVDIFGF